MADEERSIFIDDDWKARVRREKEEARRKAEEEAAQKTAVRPQSATPDSPPAAGPAHAVNDEAAMPEGMDELQGDDAPSFLALVSSLAAQTMLALGVLVPRDTQQVYVNLDEARYTIELIGILREKTKGNLTPQESGQLDATLAELQQIYVARVQQAQEQAMRQAGIDPSKLKDGPAGV